MKTVQSKKKLFFRYFSFSLIHNNAMFSDVNYPRISSKHKSFSFFFQITTLCCHSIIVIPLAVFKKT